MQNNDGKLFANVSEKCSVSVTFADDASIILKTRRGESLTMSNRLDQILDKLELFLKSNCLQLNKSKTQLLRITPRQWLIANGGEDVLLQAVDKENKWISPGQSVKILGLTFNNNFLWTNHLESGEESLI